MMMTFHFSLCDLLARVKIWLYGLVVNLLGQFVDTV